MAHEHNKNDLLALLHKPLLTEKQLKRLMVSAVRPRHIPCKPKIIYLKSKDAKHGDRK